MPAATPRLALPYPIPDDAVDVPRDVQALAAKLDALTALKPPLVSVLPSAPVDGDEVYFQDTQMSNFGVVWHLRYRAAITSYKWEFIGGAPLAHEVGAAQGIGTVSVWQNLGTDGPLVAAPLAGIYNVNYGMGVGLGARGVQGNTGISLGDTNPQGQGQTITYSPDSGSPYATSMIVMAGSRARLPAVAAGQIIKVRYNGNLVNSGQLNFRDRWIDVLPQRVGTP